MVSWEGDWCAYTAVIGFRHKTGTKRHCDPVFDNISGTFDLRKVCIWI
jgi:hypothetical protein